MEFLLRKISMSPHQEKTALTGDTTDERWFPSTSGNSPRKDHEHRYVYFYYIQISHKFVGYNNSTDHGKAVSNNKENGYHLLAQPDRMNVRTTNLSDPKE